MDDYEKENARKLENQRKYEQEMKKNIEKNNKKVE